MIKEAVITKREVLKQFAEEGHCVGIDCGECPYNNTCNEGSRPSIKDKLVKIGAKVILQKFPEKTKPTLDDGTKIEFSNGSTMELTRLPKIEFEKVPDTYNKCSSCYRYIYNGYAQCRGPQPECVLHNYRYYQPINCVKEKK